MKISARLILFWIMAILFFVATPSIILYSKGYRFDFDRKVFVYGGAITVKSNPLDIQIYLDNEINDSKRLNRINSYFNITRLLPKSYNLKISVDGFQEWSKKIDVHSGWATEFWNVLLVRNEYEKKPFETSGIEKFFTSPSNEFIAYNKQEGGNLSVNILDIKNNQNLFSISIPDYKLLSEDKKENIEWSPVNNNFLSIPAELAKTPEPEKNKRIIIPQKRAFDYFIYDIENNSQFSLKDFLEIDELKNVRWDPKDENYLFFLSQNSLYRANIQNKKDLKIVAQDISSYDLTKNKIYFTSLENSLLYSSDLQGESGALQITFDFPGNTENEIIDRLIIYDEDRVVFISQSKNLYVLNIGEHDKYFKNVGHEIEGASFSDDGKKLLFWTKNEISTYFIRDWKVQPIRAEDQVINIVRYSEELKNIQWFKDYEHIIFSVGKQTKIAELDTRDRINIMNLPITSINSFVIYNGYLEELFFTDKINDSTGLYSIIFPEAVLGIFGF